MIRKASVVTHRRPEVTAEALASLLTATARAGVTLCCGVEEIDKHGDLESLSAQDRRWPRRSTSTSVSRSAATARS